MLNIYLIVIDRSGFCRKFFKIPSLPVDYSATSMYQMNVRDARTERERSYPSPGQEQCAKRPALLRGWGSQSHLFNGFFSVAINKVALLILTFRTRDLNRVDGQ